jgi:small conductance mechanosensitive channel
MRAVVRRILQRYEAKIGPSMVRLGYRLVYYALLALTVALGLVALGVSAAVVSTVTLLILVILALALRQSVADLAATVIFLVFEPFKRGELVETVGHLGDVQEILLLSTVLRLPDHRLVSLPNSKIQADGVVNYTRIGRVRLDFRFTVAYGQDLDRIRAVVREIVSADERVLASPPFQIVVDDLADTGVRLLALPTVASQEYWNVRGDLRERIKARFDAEGIRFAVPPRDVTLRPPAPKGADPA